METHAQFCKQSFTQLKHDETMITINWKGNSVQGTIAEVKDGGILLNLKSSRVTRYIPYDAIDHWDVPRTEAKPQTPKAKAAGGRG